MTNARQAPLIRATLLNLAMVAAVTTTVAAQDPPLPPTPPARVTAPRPAQQGRPAIAPTPPAPAPAPAPARAPVRAPYAVTLPGLNGQLGFLNEEQRDLVREQARMQADLAREQMTFDRDAIREAQQQALEATRIDRDIVRAAQEAAREASRIDVQGLREQALDMGRIGTTIATPMIAPQPRPGTWMLAGSPGAERPPSPWAQGDPADSAYRAAYAALNKGDYRQAATMFKEVPAKFPYSAYAADAMYWSAHALYRMGSTPDLQDALQMLDQLKTKYPNSRLRNSQTDVASLQMRIAGVLSQRGQGGSDIVKRALAAGGGTVCDNEEQQVRSAALNALMQTDPDAAMQYALKMLAKKDDCSRDLRRNALFLIGDKRDAKATATLISVAKTDPSSDVRQAAVSYLGRIQTDEALGALEDLMKSSDDQNVQREAIRSLARNPNPRARAGIKALVERGDVTEQLRITALDALNPEQATQDDVAWLQGLYGKMDSPRIRSRIISAMGRIGGAQNEKWFTTLANNENESIEVRLEAVRRAGAAMDVSGLSKLYDQTGQRQLRMELVRQMGSRKEPETIDKLAEIIKNGTDPEVRQRAISALMSKKDARATKLLMELIDKP